MTASASATAAAQAPDRGAATREENIGALIRANSENFPVGSFLIPPDCRPHVHAFYLFARKADDIADSPTIPAAEKVARLRAARDALGHDEAALPDWAVPYHRSLVETGCGVQNGRDLLSAFIQDATKRRYADWDELMDYCRRSAASVGRVMMDIHGETAHADIEGSDALCNALQVLNHLQDCREDFLALDRVYLYRSPGSGMRGAASRCWRNAGRHRRCGGPSTAASKAPQACCAVPRRCRARSAAGASAGSAR